MVTVSMGMQRQSNARERILSAAYDLFSQRGIRAVGVDELIAASGVANATFYRHFPSKDALALAFLDRREELWTLGTIVSQALARAESPKAQLLAIFDIFDEWFQHPDFEGDPFITILLEMGPDHPLGRAALERLDTVREMVRGMAIEAGLREPDSFAHSWHILMKGAIITARMGDLIAAQRAREMGKSLIARFDPNLTADENQQGVREHVR
jgi:AcrR family transcriptional regulator